MAKETCIVKCWSSEINTKIAIYESFGWELISNNVSATVQVGNDTAITAENELTFSREKSIPHHEELNTLQQQYEELQRQIESIEESEPEEKKASLLITLILVIFYIVPGIVYYVGYTFSQKQKMKKWHEQYDASLADMRSRQVVLLNQSKAIVDVV